MNITVYVYVTKVGGETPVLHFSPSLRSDFPEGATVLGPWPITVKATGPVTPRFRWETA